MEIKTALRSWDVPVRAGRGKSSENDPLAIRYYLFPGDKAWLRQRNRRSTINLGGQKRLYCPHWECAWSNTNGHFSRIDLLALGRSMRLALQEHWATIYSAWMKQFTTTSPHALEELITSLGWAACASGGLFLLNIQRTGTAWELLTRPGE